MKTTDSFKRFIATFTLGVLIITNLNPLAAFALSWSNKSDKIIYPLKEISKLECRFELFSSLNSNCKQSLPILHTKDYEKYAKQNWGYNDYTRIYTVLWWSSYKYGWDIWNGWHLWNDIATAKGTPIYNIYEWVVINAKKDPYLWNYVSIEHNIRWKKVVSNYAHMSKRLVTKWQRVWIWYKIWEVWSTWNSTWNHLHFQIDIESPFYPYYYDYNACPYSYNKISETWVCFNEMKKHTIDPMLFLETSGKILDSINITTKTIDLSNYKTAKNNNEVKWFDMSIFSRTVYRWYSSSDIKKVQQIFKDLRKYNWLINGNYSDIENSIISYQVSNNVVQNKTSIWAGWFGPKTRSKVKNDYEKYLKNWWKPGIIKKIAKKTTISIRNTIKTKKISKRWLLSREEIEARDIKTFFEKYNIDLKLNNIWWNIEVWTTNILSLKVTDKRGRLFKWNMPWWMTFVVNTKKLQVFPTKLYYFTNWKRNIKLTWLKSGTINLKVKIWKQVVKSINLNIYKPWKAVYPEIWMIYSSKNIVLSDNKTAIALFRDKTWKKLINYKYWSTYTLKGNNDIQVCIKSWDLRNIKRIYKNKCSDSDYKKEITFNYWDTVAGLLLFDYRVTWKNASLKILNNYDKKILANKKIIVNNPKWLKNTYVYKNEVIKMLESWVVSWINRWLIKWEWVSWIKNTLNILKKEVIDPSITKKIKTNLYLIQNEKTNKYKKLTRNDFLDLVYKYLVFDKSGKSSSMDYRDLDSNGNNKIASIFDKNNTWKDKFWENYYRPKVEITRWEWAYFLTKIINKNKTTFLTLK